MTKVVEEGLTQEAVSKSRSIVAGIMQKATTKGTMDGLKDQDVGTLLASYKTQIARAIPGHLTPDRMIQMAATLISRNPRIAKCDIKSLIGAVMQASILGLPPVDALGYCYFVPYGNQVQFQIGYKGYIDLARRSGQLAKIYAEAVYEKDDFSYERGLEPKLIHKPYMAGERGKLVCVYAVYHLKDGFSDFIVLSAADVEGYRKRSQSQQKGIEGAWKTDYASMAKKTAIRRLATYLPLQVDRMEQALASDEAVLSPDSFAPDQSGELLFTEAVIVDNETGEIVAETEVVAEVPTTSTPVVAEVKTETTEAPLPKGVTKKPTERKLAFEAE